MSKHYGVPQIFQTATCCQPMIGGDLVPIRVDATSADGTIRIIDTLLVDLGCLPVPFIPEDMSSSIDDNVRELASTLLSDMEVHGVVRSARHFTGRIELWNKVGLKNRVEDQIRSQLSVALWDDGIRQKRDGEGSTEGIARSGKRRRVEGGSVAGDSQGSVNAKQEKEVEGREKMVSVASQPTAAATVSSGAASDSGTSPQKKRKVPPKSQLVRIKLRLRENGILLVDEFDWDIATPSREGGCPFAVAQNIVQDLNLPSEFAVSIATSIVEQLHGLHVEDSLVGMEARARRDVPAAWAMEGRENASATAHILSDCNPARVSP